MKTAELPKERLGHVQPFLLEKEGETQMNAKVVTFRIKPGKKEEVIRLFSEFIVPGAKKLKGFRGGLLLTDPGTGQAKSIALWETEEDIKASESGGYYKEWVAKLSDFIATPPVRELYEVSNHINLAVK
jgi:quinol monooxygenase YgiN